MKYYLSCLFISLLLSNTISAQGLLSQSHNHFSHQDTLRGSITPERAWWDLKRYELNMKVNPADSTIVGSNTIRYQVLQSYNTMQIDLQEPMNITKVIQDGEELHFEREGNVFHIALVVPQNRGDIKEILIFYEGKPRIAVNPPWDGGITWNKDIHGNPFIASTCQGLGASVWWPNKDHMYDEVDEMDIAVTVPNNLIEVSNGVLQVIVANKDGTNTYIWQVSNPINNYGVSINIGDYVSFSEVYQGEKGALNCDYYVLKDNLDKAKIHFKEVPRMLKAFEHWFGPYPFYEDSYKLVEAPYLGMEHQSCVTYGNGYQNGYLGTDRSGTAWGLKFDFIIIHESGHEWFANSITNKDIADMWIHESFTCYSESLFLEYYYGKTASSEYVRGLRKNIENQKPMIGNYDVNNEGADLYDKGANMLHTLRQVVNDDEKWRAILRGMNRTFYHQTVTSKQIEDYLSLETGLDLNPFFNQYLRDIRIPVFEYKINKNRVSYRWANCVADFAIPIKVYLDGKRKWLKPTEKWAVLPQKSNDLKVDVNFYVKTLKSK